MKALIFTLAIIIGVALAAQKGWLFFTSDSQHLTAGINRDVVERDSRKMVDSVQNLVEKVEDKVEQSFETEGSAVQPAGDEEQSGQTDALPNVEQDDGQR